MSVIRLGWQSDVAPTSVILSDKTNTYGVRQRGTLTTMVEAGIAMVAVGDGVYEYEFDDPDGLGFEYWIRVIDDTDTYHIHKVDNSESGLRPAEESVESPALVLCSWLLTQNLVSDPDTINLADAQSGDVVWPAGVGAIQDKPDRFVVLYDSGGETEGCIMTSRGRVSIEHGDVQVRVRGKNYMDALRKVHSLKDALLTIHDAIVAVESGDPNSPPRQYRINAITPLSRESYLGPDAANRSEFTVNFRTTIQKLVQS